MLKRVLSLSLCTFLLMSWERVLAHDGVSSELQSAQLTFDARKAMDQHDYIRVLESAQQAVAVDSSNALAYVYLAIASNNLRRYPLAVNAADAALTLQPDNVPARQSRSWALSRLRRYSAGLSDAQYTLARDSNSAIAWRNQAFAFAGLLHPDAAREAALKAADIDPEHFRGLYERLVHLPGPDLAAAFNDDVQPLIPAAHLPSKRRYLHLTLLSLSGGLLACLGALYAFSYSWPEKILKMIRQAMHGQPTSFSAQYKIRRTLGCGGMGIVYEGFDRALERKVAIKQMRAEIRDHPRERKRFLDEARMVAALHHPNIVTLYSIVEDKGEIYLIFEYVAGRTLYQLLSERGTISLKSARKITKAVAVAIAYAHRKQIIHRDLNPANIMISDDGQIKVMDFGVARQAKDFMTKMSMVQTNTVVGTPSYMAPEQEEGAVRREADIYSLGICFYQMLTGRLPFPAQGGALSRDKAAGKYDPLSRWARPGLPSGLDQFIDRTLAPDPDKRFRTAAELVTELDAICDSTPPAMGS